MFEALSKGFRQAMNRLSGLTELTEANIDTALREVRLSLLEADVELGVVKRFLVRVKDKALGETVQTRVKTEAGIRSVSASDVFIKICHDELVAMMNHEGERIRYADQGPTGIMMVGLQGAGKTTSAAKFANFLRKRGKKPLLIAADMQRPAAVEQLKVLGKQINIPVFHMEGVDPVDICMKGLEEARKNGHDVVIFDTAGRLAVDEALMQQLEAIKARVVPHNIFLVIDAMIGQDAVKTAKTFHDRLSLSGVILTKLDGDARGGAALSVKEVTGVSPVFVGMGETLDKFEEFRADGMATRILGMGDVVGLMKDFEQVIDKEKAAEDAMKMLQGEFSLDDLLNQLRMIKRMGSLKDIVEKLPMFSGGIPQGVNLDDRELVKMEAIIQSMTRSEKKDVHALIREPSRVRRIAKGSGTKEEDVNEVVQKYLFMKQMMGMMGQNLGLWGRIPGLKQMAMARNIKKAMSGGGFPGMPGMGIPGMGFPGMPGMGFPGIPGLGMPGMGMPSTSAPSAQSSEVPKMKVLSHAERNAKKAQRRREREARKKNRK
ncbi:MAG: signal recognition particle protein [Myxococcales bacterium]|nr:signal recognition particle protein [Polyangiaceae bacterium]MDW8248501.1 signal recognition particle protein [Myxococcales bacterium]